MKSCTFFTFTITPKKLLIVVKTWILTVKILLYSISWSLPNGAKPLQNLRNGARLADIAEWNKYNGCVIKDGDSGWFGGYSPQDFTELPSAQKCLWTVSTFIIFMIFFLLVFLANTGVVSQNSLTLLLSVLWQH